MTADTTTDDVKEVEDSGSTGQALSGGTEDRRGSGKKRHRKLFIVPGVVVVLMAAGVGFGIWHEQPSFCNSICHSPMDNYVEGYYSDDTALLVAAHARAEVSCLDCHESVLSEQVVEGIAWLKRDFSVDEEGFIAGETAADLGTRELCFKCHNDGDAATGEDWEDIQAATVEFGGDEGMNPHKSHNGNQECSDCHQSHGTSVLSCDKCHGFEPPTGWVMPKLF